MPLTLTDVDKHKKGLTDEQQKKWLKIYNSAFSACRAAGVEDEKDCHVQALRIASSRVDSALELRADGIYEGTWPSPGKGAPRNPYGGFSSLDYPGGKAEWLPAWKAHFAGIKDPKEFSDVSEWLWAVASAVKADIPDDVYQVDPRSEDSFDVTIYSTPANYSLSKWKTPPEGMSLLDVSLPTDLEIIDLHRAYWAERKRKEVDGLLNLQDRADASLRQSFGEARVVRHDEDAGLLIVDVPIAKMTVLPYRDTDGTIVNELKHPRDFATSAFLSSVRGRPVVDGHARNGVAFDRMTEDERVRYTCGFTHTAADRVWVEDSLIWTREVIFDEALIASLEAGEKLEVSTGILAVVVEEEGVYDGLNYQRRQTRPVLDHLAHVPRGRCGPECAVVLDGATEVTESHVGGNTMVDEKKPKAPGSTETKNDQEQQPTASVLRLDKAEIALCPEVKADDVAAFQTAIDALVQGKKDAEAATAGLQAKLDAAKGEGDGKDAVIKTLQDELKSVQEAQTKLDAGLDTRLDERVDMIAFMQDLISDEYDYHGKSVAGMRIDALKHFDEKFDAKDLSEDYIRARFDTVREFYDRQTKDPTGPFDLRTPPSGRPKEDEADKAAGARTTALWSNPNKKKQEE